MPSDLVDSLAQVKGVINAQGGDARDSRPFDNVRRIILASHSNLTDGGIDTLLQEDMVTHQRQVAEIHRLLAWRGGVGS